MTTEPSFHHHGQALNQQAKKRPSRLTTSPLAERRSRRGRIVPHANEDKDTTSIHHDGKKEEFGGGERSSCRCSIHAYG